MTFIVTYRCPRCDAALEARSSDAYSWLRCPRCGRASLPPEHMRAPRPRPREPLAEGVLIIGPDPDPPGTTANGRSPSRPGSFRRISGATAMFLSLLIALVSLLEQDLGSAMVFAFIALLCLAFSIYPARSRMA